MGARGRRALFVVASVLVVQTLMWLLIGQQRLVLSVPQMAVHDFSLYEAHERKYHLPVNGAMQLLVCDDVRRGLGVAGMSRLSAALSRFNITIARTASERTALQLCLGAGWQSPLLAKAETWVVPQAGGLGGNGFDHYYLCVFGAWVHLRTRMAWVS